MVRLPVGAGMGENGAATEGRSLVEITSFLYAAPGLAEQGESTVTCWLGPSRGAGMLVGLLLTTTYKYVCPMLWTEGIRMRLAKRKVNRSKPRPPRKQCLRSNENRIGAQPHNVKKINASIAT